MIDEVLVEDAHDIHHMTGRRIPKHPRRRKTVFHVPNRKRCCARTLPFRLISECISPCLPQETSLAYGTRSCSLQSRSTPYTFEEIAMTIKILTAACGLYAAFLL